MEKTVLVKAVDGYSEKLKPISDGVWEYQKPSSNGCYISEASLEQILYYLSNETFGIVSPVFPEEPTSNNVERLASIRTSVQDLRISLYHVIGQWHGNESDNYTLDKGYILIKPQHMPMERFSGFMQQAIKSYGQDAFVIKSPGEDLSCIDKEGNIIQAYSGDISIDLLAKAYSCRLPMDRRFSFMGLEISNGSIMSFRLFKGLGVEFYLPEDFFERRKVKAK